MTLAIVLTACGAGILVPYISLRGKKRVAQAIFLKIGISLLFLLTTLVCALASKELPKYLVVGMIAGQIFGLCGDFWLDLKDIYPQHHDPYVFMGFSSFLVGHLLFVGGLTQQYGTNWKRLLLAAAAGVVLACAVLLTEKPMKLKYGKFKLISGTYSLVFGFTIATAFFCAIARNSYGQIVATHPQALIMAIGLVVFLLSDLVLSGTFFGEGKDRTIDYALNYIFYFGGQFTISLSLLAATNAVAFLA